MTTTYLSDQGEFDIEREFYCPCCKDFRDVFAGPPGDIVCQKCYYVIASFKDREIVRSAKPMALITEILKVAREAYETSDKVETVMLAQRIRNLILLGSAESIVAADATDAAPCPACGTIDCDHEPYFH